MTPTYMVSRLTAVVIAVLTLSACDPNLASHSSDSKRSEPFRTKEYSKIVPSWAADTTWMDVRAREQTANIKHSDVFSAFSFSEQIQYSGITFKHVAVDDGAIDYKAVHYDHGTGVAAADVNGDGYTDIYFVNQIGANELWLNLGNGKFKDGTKNAGVALDSQIGSGASFADIDNDGDQDLFVTSIRGGNTLFENDGNGQFKDISTDAGLDYVGHSAGSVFFDYNNDGLLDLYLTNVGVFTTDKRSKSGYFVGIENAFDGHTKPDRTENSIFYRNEGGNRFVDVTAATGLENGGWSGDVGVLDANNDGWLDIYVLSMQGPDSYFENQQGVKFEDKTQQLFPNTSWGSMGIQIFDWDNDGDQDIYVTDMHSDMPQPVRPFLSEEKRKAKLIDRKKYYITCDDCIFGNTFFENNGDASFLEVSDEINAENYWPWGLSSGDLNADGYSDVFIASSMNYPFRYSINSILLNDAGSKFIDAEFVLGIEPRVDGEFVPWFELDCKNGDKNHRDCSNQIEAEKTIIYASVGSRSSVMFDIDGDHDLDIVANEFNSGPKLWINDLANRKKINAISIKLTGNKSNRNGIGVSVTVKADGKQYTQVATGKSGYMSQSQLPLYFGLGESSLIDSIEITWPSGLTQAISGPLKTNQLLEIVESAG